MCSPTTLRATGGHSNLDDQFAGAAFGPILHPRFGNEERVLGVMPAPIMVVAVFDAYHGRPFQNCSVDLVHARLFVRADADAVADKLAREFRKVFGDEAIAAFEHLAARHPGAESHTQFQLRFIETLPDLLVFGTRLAEEVGADKVGVVAETDRSHVDLHEVAALHNRAHWEWRVGRERVFRPASDVDETDSIRTLADHPTGRGLKEVVVSTADLNGVAEGCVRLNGDLGRPAQAPDLLLGLHHATEFQERAGIDDTIALQKTVELRLVSGRQDFTFRADHQTLDLTVGKHGLRRLEKVRVEGRVEA